LRLLRYSFRTDKPWTLARLGVLLPGNQVGDLQAGYMRHLAAQQRAATDRVIAMQQLPAETADLLRIGNPAWEAACAALACLAELAKNTADARGPDGERLILPLSECRLHAPLTPGKIVAIGRN
jgi:hypothetical protein